MRARLEAKSSCSTAATPAPSPAPFAQRVRSKSTWPEHSEVDAGELCSQLQEPSSRPGRAKKARFTRTPSWKVSLQGPPTSTQMAASPPARFIAYTAEKLRVEGRQSPRKFEFDEAGALVVARPGNRAPTAVPLISAKNTVSPPSATEPSRRPVELPTRERSEASRPCLDSRHARCRPRGDAGDVMANRRDFLLSLRRLPPPRPPPLRRWRQRRSRSPQPLHQRPLNSREQRPTQPPSPPSSPRQCRQRGRHR